MNPTTKTSNSRHPKSIHPGSVLSMVDGAIGTFNLQQESGFAGAGLVIGGASGAAPTLAFEIGNGGAGTDEIDVTKAALVLATGGKITIDPLAGDTSLTVGNYDLITAAGGFSGTGGNGLSLSGTTIALDGTTYRLSLANSTTTQEVLSVSLFAGPKASAAREESGGLASSPESVPAAVGDKAIGQETANAGAAARGISAPRDLAGAPISTAAVPEPENWASGIAALVSLGLLARRRRVRNGTRGGFA